MPVDADHLTPTLDVFLTKALHCTLPWDATAVMPGVTLTEIRDLEFSIVAAGPLLFDWLKERTGDDRMAIRPNTTGRQFLMCDLSS